MTDDYAGRRSARIPLKEWLAKLAARGLSGAKFMPDPVPVAPPVGYKRVPSMVETIREMVRSERLAAEAAAMGHETFEEADDLDIPDDPPDLHSQWENEFDPPVAEVVKAGKEVVEERERKKRAKPAEGGSVKTAEGAREGLDSPDPE